MRETITVTATIEPVPLRSAARELSLVSRDELERLPTTSLADALRLVTSVEVRARGAFGTQADFQIRGASFGQSLILVDGIRINDAQSGHHNADLPVSADEVDRIEVLRGIGSSLHGADAFGGTIHVVTRASEGWRGGLSAGSFGAVAGRASFGARVGDRAIEGAASASHTDGFMPDRDADEKRARVRAGLDSKTTLTLAHLDKEFGANGFYGPSPSREWTQQTMAALSRRLGDPASATSGAVNAFYRTHADHFIYNRFNPALSENRHRTHAFGADARLGRAVGDGIRIAGGIAAGEDRVRSNNLGDHSYARASVFGEAQIVRGKTLVYPGVRFDTYQSFGSSVSPSLALARSLGSSFTVRASGGHAFRVPTYTELYYRDPNNQARSDLTPEKAWSVESGVEWAGVQGLILSATAFSRWDDSVIDWVRASTLEKWHTENLRDVRTRGLEFGVRHSLRGRGTLSLGFTGLRQSSSVAATLSKYVLDYAPRSFAGALSGRVGRVFEGGVSTNYKLRKDRRSYWLVDARVSRALGRARVFVDGLNLLDTTYEEVKGVAMPGRSIAAGISFASRGSRP